MATLVVNGVTISVKQDGGADHDYEEVGGEHVRMDDASMASTVKARKNVWTFVSAMVDDSTATSYYNAIIAGPPVTCSGDVLGGSVSCHGQVLKKEFVPIGGSIYRRLHFRLMEA